MGFDIYDAYPEAMLAYLRNYGWHFSKKACEFACSKMRRMNPSTGKLERIDMMTKDDVDALLTRQNIILDNASLYDYVYVANMCKSDHYGSAIPDEAHLARFIKDVIDDIDGEDGCIFTRWYADMTHKGIPIGWEDII